MNVTNIIPYAVTLARLITSNFLGQFTAQEAVTINPKVLHSSSYGSENKQIVITGQKKTYYTAYKQSRKQAQACIIHSALHHIPNQDAIFPHKWR